MNAIKAAKRSAALLAFDALVDARFVPMDLALDTIEAEQKRDRELAASRAIWQWSDVIREAAGVGFANIARATVPWQPPWKAQFETQRRLWHNHAENVVTGPCKVFFGKNGDSFGEKYCALLQAHEVLSGEKRCLVKDNYRMFRRLKRVATVSGYDPSSAFDWYVILVATLRQAGVALRGYDVPALSRPIRLPAGVLSPAPVELPGGAL